MTGVQTCALPISCYLQRPGVPHVDYGAAIEGRLIDPSRPRGGFVDWVVICENCLRAGVALLPDERRDRDAEHKALVAQLEAELRKSAEYIAQLEAAFAAREHVRPTVKPAPKPEPKQQRKTRYEAKS